MTPVTELRVEVRTMNSQPTGKNGSKPAPASTLEPLLVGAKDLHRLPGKFGFLIDDGGAVSLADEPADIRFDYRKGCGDFSVSIGGTADEVISLGVCAANDP